MWRERSYRQKFFVSVVALTRARLRSTAASADETDRMTSLWHHRTSDITLTFVRVSCSRPGDWLDSWLAPRSLNRSRVFQSWNNCLEVLPRWLPSAKPGLRGFWFRFPLRAFGSRLRLCRCVRSLEASSSLKSFLKFEGFINCHKDFYQI